MKFCEKCGVEIINGVNGCQFTGYKCFDCFERPDYSRAPARRGADWMPDDAETVEASATANTDD